MTRDLGFKVVVLCEGEYFKTVHFRDEVITRC